MRCGDKVLESISCIPSSDRELLLDFLRGLSNDIVSLACSDYNEYTNRCEQLEPLEYSTNPAAMEYESILNIMIEMIESLDTLWIE